MGLSLTVAFSIMIIDWRHLINELEVHGDSLERIKRYLGIGHEPKPFKENTPPACRPASGELAVEKLSARYSVVSPLAMP